MTSSISTEQAQILERDAWSHDQFIRQVIAIARGLGWKVASFRPGRTKQLRKDGTEIWKTPIQGDAKGWPDLVLCHGKRKMAWELKVKRDKPRLDQLAWLATLEAAGYEVAVCYPRHWEVMMKLLERT